MSKVDECPRCEGDNVEDYGDIIECKDCQLEFEKRYLQIIEDKSAILSIKEKKDVVRIFKIKM